MTHISHTTPRSGQTNRIIFFGTEEFSADSLRALIDSGYLIAAVVTKPDSIKGRGHTLIPPTVKIIAESHGIPVWQPAKLAEIHDNIADLQPVTGVLVSYGKIIPQSIINLFTPGIINVHPSKLPLYRGPSPIEAAILNGDSHTGVSIMQLSAAMDAGPVYTFTPYKLQGDETQESLYKTLGEIGATKLVAILPSIIDSSLTPNPQNEDSATYCKLIEKSAGNIDWTKSAQQIEREIRAYHTWPKSRTNLNEIDTIITAAYVVSPEDKKEPGTVEVDNERQTVLIHAGIDALSIERLKPMGKKEMPVRAFLAGYKGRL